MPTIIKHRPEPSCNDGPALPKQSFLSDTLTINTHTHTTEITGQSDSHHIMTFLNDVDNKGQGGQGGISPHISVVVREQHSFSTWTCMEIHCSWSLGCSSPLLSNPVPKAMFFYVDKCMCLFSTHAYMSHDSSHNPLCPQHCIIF